MQPTLSWPSPPTAVPTHGRACHLTRLTSRTRGIPVTSRVAPHRPYKGLTPCSSPSRGRRATLASWLCHPSFLSRTPWPAPPFCIPLALLAVSITAPAHSGDSRSSPSSHSLNAHCDDSFQLLSKPRPLPSRPSDAPSPPPPSSPGGAPTPCGFLHAGRASEHPPVIADWILTMTHMTGRESRVRCLALWCTRNCAWPSESSPPPPGEF